MTGNRRQETGIGFIIFFLIGFLFYSGRTSASDKSEEEIFSVAEKVFSNGLYKTGLSLFEQFVDDYPESKEIYKAKLFIAKCYYFTNNNAYAFNVLNELLKINEPRNLFDEVHYFLGEVSSRRKNPSEAIYNFKKVIQTYPESSYYWPAYYKIAEMSSSAGREKTTEFILRKIIDKNGKGKNLEDIYAKLLSFYFEKKKYHNLLYLGNKYLKNYPQGNLSVNVNYYLGEASYHINSLDNALIYYRSALKRNSGNYLTDFIYKGLGLTYLSQGNILEAAINIEKINDEELYLFTKGIYLFKKNEYIEALKKFNLFSSKFPESKYFTAASLYSAEILYKMGRVNDSLYVYNSLQNISREYQKEDFLAKIHYGLARAYVKNAEFRKAIEEFNNTLKYLNDYTLKAGIRLEIADIYDEIEEYPSALNIYKEIMQDKNHTVYSDYVQFKIGIISFKTNEEDEGILAFKAILKNYPLSKLTPSAYYYLAMIYFSKNELSEAKNLLYDFIKNFPQDPLIYKVYYFYGKCLLLEKNYKESMLVLEKAASSSSGKDIEELTAIELGYCYFNLSMLDRAKKIWEDILIKFPASQYVHSIRLNLAGIYAKENDFDTAAKYYKKVIEENTNPSLSNEAALSLGNLYLSQNKISEAQEIFKKLELQNSDYSLKAKLYLARIYKMQGKTEDALNIYDELAFEPSSLSKIAYFEKANLLKEMKDYANAIIFFNKAIDAGYDTASVKFSLAMCLEKINRTKEAVEEYFKVLSMPENSGYELKTYFRIARIYEKEGNKEGAKEIYRKISKLNVEEAKIARAKLNELEEDKNVEIHH